jgi:endonuclease YncB( thermonuclease family)
VLLICACLPPGQTGTTDAPTRPGDLTSGRVVRTNDGDSGVVASNGAEIEVRLMGVNAPEQGECYGQESSDHLAGLIEGELVDLEVIGTDQFDRTLAYVWLDDLLVNHELVIQGFAIATTPEDGDPHGKMLIAAEEAAFGAGSGMWSETACGSSGAMPVVGIDGAGSSFDPAGPDEEVLDREWVSFTGEGSAVLGGWMIRDESSEHRCRLPSGTVITEGGVLAVTSADPCWDPGGRPVWNNGGDLALLLDGTGRVVARYRYTG